MLTENNQNARFIAVDFAIECIFSIENGFAFTQADDDLIFLIFWRDQFNKKILGIFMHEIEKQKHRVSFRLIQWQQWVSFFSSLFSIRSSYNVQFHFNIDWIQNGNLNRKKNERVLFKKFFWKWILMLKYNMYISNQINK